MITLKRLLILTFHQKKGRRMQMQKKKTLDEKYFLAKK